MRIYSKKGDDMGIYCNFLPHKSCCPGLYCLAKNPGNIKMKRKCSLSTGYKHSYIQLKIQLIIHMFLKSHLLEVNCLKIIIISRIYTISKTFVFDMYRYLKAKRRW